MRMGRRTDWGGHMKPNFNHLCRSIEVDREDVIRFRLLEKNFGDLGTPTFCAPQAVVFAVGSRW